MPRKVDVWVNLYLYEMIIGCVFNPYTHLRCLIDHLNKYVEFRDDVRKSTEEVVIDSSCDFNGNIRRFGRHIISYTRIQNATVFNVFESIRHCDRACLDGGVASELDGDAAPACMVYLAIHGVQFQSSIYTQSTSVMELPPPPPKKKNTYIDHFRTKATVRST